MKQFSEKRISPVTQFVLLLSPVVMSCFFLIYAISGWVVEGRDKDNWSIEASSVAVWVCIGMIGYCALVLLYARWKGASRFHALYLSSWGHIVLSLLLFASVIIAIKS